MVFRTGSVFVCVTNGGNVFCGVKVDGGSEGGCGKGVELVVMLTGVHGGWVCFVG